MMQQVEVERSGLIQSVQRAIALLKAFDSDGVLGVSELGRRTNLHKSTVSRLLATLEQEGLIERVAGSDKYQLGFELIRLAGLVPYFQDLREAARPVLHELAERSRETVNLAVFDGDEVVNIEQISGPHLVRDTNWVGRRTAPHGVANGKALLAFRPPAEIERVLGGPLPRYTRRTITDPTALRDELAAVRERGYAIALGELEDGLNAVAAPIAGEAGSMIAAISVAGPAYRVTPDRIPALGAFAIEAAKRIAARMGFVP
jgi:DNA-binding IclR family transcriptional regulator